MIQALKTKPATVSLSSGDNNAYNVPGIGDVTRVTQFLQVINKPALVPWAAKQERELVIQCAERLHANNLKHNRADMPAVSFAANLKIAIGAEKAHQKISSKAMEIGTQVHKMVEHLVREMMSIESTKPEISPVAQGAVDHWTRWADSVGFKPVECEMSLAETSNKDRRFWYAGTLDALALVNGKLTLCDWKTGSGIYPEAHFQNAAYRYMVDNDPRWPDTEQGLIVLLPKRKSIEFQTALIGKDYTNDLAVFRAAQFIYASLKDMR